MNVSVLPTAKMSQYTHNGYTAFDYAVICVVFCSCLHFKKIKKPCFAMEVLSKQVVCR